MTARQYIELCKPRIGFMITLTALLGYLLIAETLVAWQLGALALATLLGSSSSSVFNHFFDRDIDRLMDRTRGRPLASGAVSQPTRVLWFAAILMALSMGIASIALNWVVAAHIFLGAFVYGVVYTVWLKRRTWWNIVIGGAAGSFAVLAGAAAVDPGQWLLPCLMAIFLFLWTPSHFWALAILLKDDYARAGVPMLPVLVGEARTARAILWNTVLLVASSLAPVAFGLLGPAYGVVTALAGAHFLWLHRALIRNPEREPARRVFFGSMQYLLVVFLAVVIDRQFGGW